MAQSRRIHRVLVVDDEPSILRTVGDALSERGLEVDAAADGSVAIEAIERRPYDVVVTDLRLPGADGLAILQAARRRNPRCGVIVITAYGTIQTAIQAVQLGALQYVTKPFDLDELLIHVDRVCEQLEIQDELERVKEELAAQRGAVELIARSPAMQRVSATIAAAAETDANVLILGESGTGKELFARSVHARSARRGGPLVAINCSAIPEALAEAELFGAERGAYTGATTRREGCFVAARGGTLFLDEVGDLPLAVQAKLLRVLEDRTLRRLGSMTEVPIDVRIVAATHHDLRLLVREGRFREDLYFRLNVVALELPPLRERREDIPLLVAHFVARYGKQLNRRAERASDEALEALLRHPWPGNVRELQNAVQRALILAEGAAIEVEHLPAEIRGAQAPAEAPTVPPAIETLDAVVLRAERAHLVRTLSATGGNRTEAARLLGVSRKHLWHKLKAHGLDAGD